MKRRRILSFAMAWVMALSVFVPGVTAYAIEPEGIPPTSECTCTAKCVEGSVDEGCAVCGAEGADLSACMGKEVAPESACTCETKCTEGSVDEGCAVCGAEGADLSACMGKEVVPEPVCTCETKCMEGSANEDCTVCGAEGANLSACMGKEAVPEPVCTCETKCTEGSVSKDCTVCGVEGVDLSACAGMPQAEPNPLSGDEFPTKDATCSYVSNENSVTGTGASLSDAVDALNRNGGGTITLTSSGWAGATNIEILSPITIIPETGKSITVTAPQRMEKYDGIFEIDRYTNSSLNEGNRVLTLGQDGLEAGVLTFDGAGLDNSCIVVGDGNGDEDSDTGVVLQDGVVLTGCTVSTIGGDSQKIPKVTMYGGQIKENDGEYALIGAPLTMMGGEVCNNVSKGSTIWAPYASNRTTIGGNAHIHDNRAEDIGGISAYGSLTIQDNAVIEKCKSTGDSTGGAAAALGDLTMKGHAKIAQCEGKVGGAAASLATLIMEDDASIEDCRSTSTAIEVYAFPGGAQAQSAQIGPNAKITGCTGVTGGLAIANTLGDAEDIAQSRIEGEISGNTGILGGGISAMTDVDVTVADGAKIVNNTATEAGGGIAVWSSISLDKDNYPKTILTVDGGTISKNTAPRGGGVFVAGRNESLDYEEEQAEHGYYVGYCYLKMSGGTITGNTAANPEGGTATEFHGGGVFLGWDVETNISGAINISGNTDANRNPSNLYLRKDPEYTVIDPAEEPEADPDKGMNGLKQFVARAAKAQAEEELNALIDQINAANEEELAEIITEYIEYGILIKDKEYTKDQIIDEFSRYVIATYQVQYIESHINAYRQQCDFVPTYEQFKLWFIDILLEYGKYELRAEFTEMTQGQLTDAAIDLGIISSDETYTGTKEDFLSDVLQVYKKQYETDPDMDESITEAYYELWDVAVAPTSTIQDARLHVTGALTGSQIGVTAEGAQNGRIVAVGTDTYPITKADLAVFTSNDPGYAVVWHPKESNQLMLGAKGHIISAYAGTGGRIYPSGSVSVLEGNSKTFTITPASGYHISDVTVDGVSKGAISTYTFENVTDAHTIEATFAKDSSGGSSGGGSGTHSDYTLRYETNGGENLQSETKKVSWTKEYTDLPTPQRDGYTFAGWYRNSALTMPITGDIKVYGTVTIYAKWNKTVVDPDDTGVSDLLNTQDHKEYLHGYDTGLFGPNNDMTRAEAAQMFYNLLLDKDVPITVNFSDVPADAWYATAVNTLASLGLVEGVGNNQFAPERAITRAEFTVIAMRFTNGDVSGENIFSDISANDWFYDQVVGSIQYGWITGYEDGTFRPNTTIARAEVTTIVNRMLGRSADVDYVDRHKDDLRLFPDVSQDYWAYYQIVEATNAHDYTKEGNTESWSKLK